jgi:hypothetical protein
VLAVVEHQQRLTDLEVLHDAVGQREAGALHAPDTGRDDLRHRVAVVDGGEFAEPCAVGEARHRLGGGLHREARLPHATRARQRDQ